MSFLIKLYQRSQTEKINQFENFCTEVLCYCFKNDNKFLKDFLTKIDSEKSENFHTTSQNVFYEEGAIPDIVLESKTTVIFIECKIDSSEGLNQLNKYANILTKKYKDKNKFLIFLTKYGEASSKDFSHLDITFRSLTWLDISDIIQIHDHFTKELKNLIHDKIMKTIKVISSNDILALQNILNVLEAYDGFFNDFAKKLENKYSKHNLNFLKSSLKKTWIDQNFAYSLVSENLIGNNGCYFWFGVYMWESKVIVCVEIGIYKERKTSKVLALKQLLKKSKFKECEGELENKQYDGFYISEALEKFKGKSSSDLESWIEKQFQLIFNYIEKSELKISMIK